MANSHFAGTTAMSRSLVCKAAAGSRPRLFASHFLKASDSSCATAHNRPSSSSTHHITCAISPARRREWPQAAQHTAPPTAATAAAAAAARRSLHTAGPARAGADGRGPQGGGGGESRTDIGALDVLAGAEAPATAVDACLPDGFKLSSGLTVRGGAGLLLVGGEAFTWRPWECVDAENNNNKNNSGNGNGNGNGNGRRLQMRLINDKGQWEVPESAFGLLSLVWPRPDLLVLGLGPEMRPLSPATRRLVSGLGLRVEVLDTRNAAAQFNLLATERGVGDVAAALVPFGWKEGVGAA
ncbi:hypothetical protein RB594_001328 [Gaeumannomyces avenae]